MVAAGARAGVPLLNGFLSKEMFFAETVAHHVDSVLDDALPVVATLAAMFSVTYSLRFIHDVFFGPIARNLPRTPHEPPRWMRFPVEFLVLACLVVGIIPAVTVGPYLNTAVRAVLGAATPEYSLAVWHGFTPALLMSVIALCGGGMLYLLLQGYLRNGFDDPPLVPDLKGRRIFERGVVAVSWRFARLLERILGTRRLQPQLRLIVCVAAVGAAWPVYSRGVGSWSWSLQLAGFDPVFAFAWVVGMFCAVGAAYQAKYHRLAALVMMGGAGLMTCLTFVWLSAPDLALTQLLVEIVTTVLLLLGLRWLPKRLEGIDDGALSTIANKARRLRDLSIAIGVGCGLSVLAYVAMTRPVVDNIGRYFVDRAYTEGGGTNIVNVILVDFRGFDTLGEITVLGAVALTVYALLRRFRPAADSVDAPRQQQKQNAYEETHPDRKKGHMIADALKIPALIVQLLFPVIGIVAAFLLLRGHDLPGGGFVAGLTMAIAFILQYMVGGTRWVEARLRILPVRWIGSGLLFAAATGIGAWLAARPFLTSYYDYAILPLIGKIPLSSALVFDLGVFTLVVGATVLILIALAHQSIRTHRAPRVAEPVPTAPAAGET
jgi:multicomponent K+:H+ antiporter subunit A